MIIKDRTSDICNDFIKKNKLSNFRVLNRKKKISNCSKALNNALDYAEGDILVFFDADNSPDRNCVKELVSRFTEDKIGVVQGRVVTKSYDSLVSKIVKLERISGFDIRFAGKEKLNLNSQFSGTVVAIRSNLLRRFGGFNEKSLTEDTDLTAKIISCGYKIVYETKAFAKEEPVHNLDNYITQHTRWATGHMKCFFENISTIIKSPISLKSKIDASLFLFYYFVPLFCGLAVLVGFFNYYYNIKFLSLNPVNLMFLYILLLSPIIELFIGILKTKEVRYIYLIPAMFVFYVLNIFICFKGVVKNIKKDNVWVKTERGSTNHNTRRGTPTLMLASLFLSVFIVLSFASPIITATAPESQDTIIIASGNSELYLEVFVAADAARSQNITLFLVNNTGDADEIIKNVPYSVNKAIIIGGPTSVSLEIENILKSKLQVERIVGDNITQLSGNVAMKFSKENESYLVDNNWYNLASVFNIGNKTIIINETPYNGPIKTVNFNIPLQDSIKTHNSIVLAEINDTYAIDVALTTNSSLLIVDDVNKETISQIAKQYGINTIITTKLGLGLYYSPEQIFEMKITKMKDSSGFIIPVPGIAY